jgi:hypothetical protein
MLVLMLKVYVNHRSDASKGCIDALMPNLDLCFNEVFFNTFSWIFTDSSIHKLAHRYWALFHFRSKHEHSTKDDARIDDIQKNDLSTNASTRSPRINNLNENIATACRRPSALW